jgi:Family of unknown function (DUF5681)
LRDRYYFWWIGIIYGASLTGNIRQMPRRANSTSFRPGQSGNPNGRPRVLADVQNAAREHSADAIKTLSDIMNNPKAPAAARISAACALLDRGYGKALQTVDANNTNVNYVVSDQPMTEEEWAERCVTEH